MKTLLALILLFQVILINAQAPRKFYMRFGGNGYDVGYDMKQTLDNGYIITGSTSSFGNGNTDMYLIKLDSLGHKKFETSFGGYNNDIGNSVVQLPDSSYVMTGYTNSTGFGGYDIFLVKVDKNGSLLWEKVIGGADWDFANSIEQTTDGGFIIGGTTYSSTYGNADGYVIKTDANGNVVWTKHFGGLNDDEFKSVIQTTDGGYALTGYTKSYNDQSFGDLWVFKLNGIGDSVTCHFYGGTKEDFGNQIIEDANGDFIIAGGTESFGTGLLDAYALKISGTFVQLWHFEDGHPTTNEVFNSVVVATSRPNLLAFAETDVLPYFGLHPKVMELESSTGFYQMATGYGDTKEDEIFKIITTYDKGLACIGYTKSFNAVLSDFFFVKMDSTLLGSVNVTSLNEQNEQKSVQLFPNPCKNLIQFKADQDQLTSLSIIDVLGKEERLIYEYTVDKYIKIDLVNYQSGIYFIKINTVAYKVIIEK